MRFLLVCLTLTSSSVYHVAKAARSEITLTNNGYSGILIAIGDGIPESSQLLEKIKDVFNDASMLLFAATRNRAAFRSVTILVPQSWSNQSQYSPATSETFDKANIVVDFSQGDYGNPYTRQAEGCGKAGEFTHFTPDFFRDENATRAKYGAPGKVIVHEWGHLRWGLFDEYPITEDISDHFYWSPSSQVIEETRCSTISTGSRKNRRTGKYCIMDASTSLPEKDCRYYPDAATVPAGSYMYYNYLTSAVKFCDNNEGDVSNVHNSESPSPQNSLCGGRSAWEVMRQHVDFAGSSNPSVDTYNTNITFKIVQRGSWTTVIVMDTSGSMTTDNNYIKQSIAVQNYVKNTLPDGSLVGLVQFATSAQKLTTTLQNISSSSSRENLAKFVQPTTTGSSSIGSGMEAALGLLTYNGRNPTGSFMVVISDGEENMSPTIADILPRVKAAGVIIDTLLFTTNADPKLTMMADETGGLRFFYSGKEDSTGLVDGLASTVISRQQSNGNTSVVTIASISLTVASRQFLCTSTVIEEELGRDTRFVFSWSNTYIFNLTITRPSKNSTYQYSSTTVDRSTTIAISGLAEAGRYNVCIENKAASSMVIGKQVTSKARNMGVGPAAIPIVVTVKTSGTVASFSGAVRPLAVYASVFRGYSPVLAATVIATVEDPSGQLTKLQLRDSGSGSDVTKDDGIYSGYFFKSALTGRHSVSVKVEGTGSTVVKLSASGSSASSIQIPGSPDATSTDQLVPTAEFERVASGGFIDVLTIPTQTGDTIPPSRIQDLALVAVENSAELVSLQFTAVGDDLDQGRAHHYLLRYTASYNNTLYGFETAMPVQSKDVVVGNLSLPATAGSIENISFQAKQGQFLVMAIVAVDAANNTSPISNVVSAKLFEVQPPVAHALKTVSCVSFVSLIALLHMAVAMLRLVL